MSQHVLIVAEIKKTLREKNLTYADVAKKLKLSVPSIKRLFSGGDLSLARIDQICELLQSDLHEILQRSRERPATNQLTLAQEQQIVSDPALLLMAWLVINRATVAEIAHTYRFSEREVLRYFFKLDQMKVIELQPGNRVRLLVSRHFSWRPGGPVQRYIHQKLLREFVDTHFTGPDDEFFFHGGEVSTQGLGELRQVLRTAARQCAEILDRDRTPRDSRRGAAFVLALRPWKYSGFREFERG